MTIEEAIKILKDGRENLNNVLDQSVAYERQHTLVALDIAIQSLEAWEKIDDDIASLQDIYSIGGTETEKAIWENLQAVRKTIHGYLKELSE